jgi:NAD(P)-dependent dehydrogenase (short-subunit alcohol dehydrogenase family)
MGLLDNQVAIITGSGQGLGKAVALEFAQEGSAVALLERNPDTLADVREQIEAAGGQVRAYHMDITDYDAYEQAVSDVVAWKGKIDTLVNNAAIALLRHDSTDTLENWQTAQ